MSVPLIDLSAGSAADHAGAVDAALRTAGFFGIVGHGVAPSVVAAAFDAGHRFFALPQAEKERWHIDRWPLRRGFNPIGWQALDATQPPDLNESFYLGIEAIGPNQWPDEALLPGFRAACNAYSEAMLQLARRLMGLFEIALDLAPGALDGFIRHPTCTTRLLHYPPQPALAEPGQIGCGAHTDWGALTLLAQDDAGGLQVKVGSRGGEQGGEPARKVANESADEAASESASEFANEWIDIPPRRDAFVVNVGDMMPRWTNDRWKSTLHRVINRVSGRDRWSIAYFFDLDAEASIEPLPSCTGVDNPPRYGPITAGEHLEAMYRRTTVVR